MIFPEVRQLILSFQIEVNNPTVQAAGNVPPAIHKLSAIAGTGKFTLVFRRSMISMALSEELRCIC
jgi:hypothetical protein